MQIHEKLTKRTNAALSAQQRIQKLEAQVVELEAKLKASQDRFMKTADILRGQVEENKQLQEQMAETKIE